MVTTGSEEDLKRSASVVEAKLAELHPRGKPQPQHAMVLVALALAHELEEARRQSEQRDSRARETLRKILAKVDGALAGDSAQSSSPAAPS